MKLAGLRFTGMAAQSGNLTATLLPMAGYELGTPLSASTRMVVLAPAITVRLSRAEYGYAEGYSAASVEVVARTQMGLPRPNRTLHVSVSTRELPGGATINEDYRPLSEEVGNDVGAGAPARRAATPSAMPAGNVIGICDRTPAVRDRLLILLRQALTPAYRGDCADVTEAWLARLTSVQLVAPGDRVTSLKRGDFAWLPNVRSVYITGQLQLATLPADVFEGLTGLEELWVFENRIATLSSGAFRGLPNLRDL